jgi:hypothetical protein
VKSQSSQNNVGSLHLVVVGRKCTVGCLELYLLDTSSLG